MRRNVILNSPRLKEIRRKKHKIARKKIMYILVFLVISFVLFSLILRIPAINIKNIEISGNKIIETREIEEIVKKEISGKYFWILPKTNFLIYPKNKIKKELSHNFKRFNKISINLNGFRTLDISVSEYEGRYLYCGTLPRSDLENNKCYFLDKNGYIFDEAPYFSGNVYFKFYGDSSINETSPNGSYFLKDKFAKIIEFKNAMDKMSLKPASFLWNENKKTGNFYLLGDSNMNPYIVFDMDSDYQKLAENLQAAISVEPLKSDLKTKISSLLYIDLRFGNKVYYKFQ